MTEYVNYLNYCQYYYSIIITTDILLLLITQQMVNALFINLPDFSSFHWYIWLSIVMIQNKILLCTSLQKNKNYFHRCQLCLLTFCKFTLRMLVSMTVNVTICRKVEISQKQRTCELSITLIYYIITGSAVATALC